MLDYLESNRALRHRLRVRSVRSDGRDKLDTLLRLLRSISGAEGADRTIIFVNHRESAERVAEFLRKAGAACVLYHGALDQRRRESALQAFNSGARPILVATDLAARGLDIEGVRNVVHYHLPLTPEAYTHRNGRTARVASEGDVYLLLGPDEELREYMEVDSPYALTEGAEGNLKSPDEVLCISAGRREKLSRGDILGYIVKECGVDASEVGKIAVFDHYSLVTLRRTAAPAVIEASRQKKIKGEKRRIGYLDAV